MSLIIKICGLKEPKTLGLALDMGADMVGFVSFPPSPRHLELSEMKPLADQARGTAKIVVLTVDADDAALLRIRDEIAPDYFQLHGKETPARIEEVARLTGLPVIKALGISENADVARIKDYMAAELRLLDAKPNAQDTRPGGLGRAFDWSLLSGIDGISPFMLSGGLNYENVADAIRDVRPQGVDVSSGVESQKGVKDPHLIKLFIERARGALL